MITRGRSTTLRKVITKSLLVGVVAAGGTIATSTGAQAITAGTDLNWSTIGKDFITTTPTRVVDTNTGLNGISGSVAANHICGVNLSAVTPAGAQGNRVFFSW